MLRACLATSAQSALLAAQLTPPAGGCCEQQQRECEHVQQICQRVHKAMRRRAQRTAAASSSRDNQSSCSGDSLGSLSSCDSFGARRHARRLLCSLRGGAGAGAGAKQPALERASADSSEETASEVSCNTAIFLGPSALQRPPNSSFSRVPPATSATPAAAPAPSPFPQCSLSLSLRQQPIPEAHELSGPQCQWLASRPQFTYSKGLTSYASSPARFPSAKQLRAHARPASASCAGPEDSQEIWVDGPPELLAPASSASPACHSTALASQTPTSLCTTLPEAVEAAAVTVVRTSNEHTDEAEAEAEAEEMVESQTSQSSQLSSASLADKGTQCDEPFSESGSTSCSTSASAPSECSVRMAHSAAQAQAQAHVQSVDADARSCLLEAPAPALPPPSRAPLSDIEEGYEGALGASTQTTQSSGSGSGSGPEAEQEAEQELISNDERRELAPVDENAESQYSAEMGLGVGLPLLHSCPPSLSSTPLHQLRDPLLGEGPEEAEAEEEVDDQETENADLQFEIGAPYENLRLIRRLTEQLAHGTKPHTIDSLYNDTPHRAVDRRPEDNRAVLSSTLLFANNSNPNGTLLL